MQNAITSPAAAKRAKGSPAVTPRERLGIPRDARRVLLFTESSHWDTNWLQTSEEYFSSRIEPIFFAVIGALEKDPDRVYCVESVFFLRLFWERHPEARDRLRALLTPTRRGRAQMRILSSSFTTPDTLLPHAEAILRDFHLGQEWLRREGLPPYPRTAYFPDNFGHSPHLPSLMRTVGVDAAAVTRIDGMYFIASDFRGKGTYPLAGSTAEVLQKQLRTLDFVWKDDDGAEILCHWNAFTYFQGDMLAHAGIVRWNGHVAAIPWRTRRHIARRIDGFVRQLEPLARTPYLLCPIGMDFNDPIVDLRELLDRYNRERYGDTGTFTVLGGLDDHFELLAEERDALPVVSVDPNPYWMGFYASRPDLKQRPMRISRTLVLAEKLSALEPRDSELEASLREGWSNVVLMNHHDAITGTSPDRVCHSEQKEWLDAAEVAAKHALKRASSRVAPAAREERARAPEVRWRRERSTLRVTTPHHRLTFSQARGWCLTSFVSHGKEQLAGVGLDLVAHADEGGLWRLGHEYLGGGFAEIERASRRPAKIDVTEIEGGVAIVIRSDLRGKRFTRTVICRGDDPLVRVRVDGIAARRQTVTCRFEMTDAPVDLHMDTIGGHIERPRERGHSPTFWPVPSLLSLRGPTHTLHAAFEAPSAVSFGPEHVLEWIVARNSTKERAFGLLPVMAHPIGGTADEAQSHEAAIFVTAGPAGHPIPSELRRHLELSWMPVDVHALKRFARTLVVCDDADAFFSAIKRADVGRGIIVRILHDRPSGKIVRVAIPSRTLVSAFLCDARERDLGELDVVGGAALVPVVRRLTTVRLVVDGSL